VSPQKNRQKYELVGSENLAVGMLATAEANERLGRMGKPGYAEVLNDLLQNPPEGEPLNWLKIAIHRLGGPAQAARALGTSRQQIYVWLKVGNTGVRGLPYRQVERLSSLSRIPVDLIGRCGSENEKGAKKPYAKRRDR
jgi:hypothetical protein